MNMWMKNKTLPLLLSAVLVVSMGGGYSGLCHR